MAQVFEAASLTNHGVLLELQLPLTSKRLDCLVTGYDRQNSPNAVIVELKQWEGCKGVSGKNTVVTFLVVLTDAATGLRVSEILALRWSDIDWKNSLIRVTRAYVYGKFGPPKSKASKRPVPLHPMLAELLQSWRNESPCAREADFIFPSFKLKGTKPLRANMLVADHLLPAARKAGITGRVGFHTLRRTLASVLVANGNDPKLVHELLRHSNVKTTLDIYAKAVTSAKLEAQGWVLEQLLTAKAQPAVTQAR